MRLFVLTCVNISSSYNCYVHELVYNAAALVESVSWLSATGIENLLVNFWNAQLSLHCVVTVTTSHKDITKCIHSPVQYIHDPVFSTVYSVSQLSATGIAGTFLKGSIEKQVTVRYLQDIAHVFVVQFSIFMT